MANNRFIIQDPKTKEFKKYEPLDLPDGTVGSFYDSCVGRYYFEITDDADRDNIFADENNNNTFKIHDIVNDKGQRTHHLRYMATDEDGGTYLYVTSPTRDSDHTFISEDHTFISENYYESKYIGDNVCGQTWENEPCEVWECI